MEQFDRLLDMRHTVVHWDKLYKKLHDPIESQNFLLQGTVEKMGDSFFNQVDFLHSNQDQVFQVIEVRFFLNIYIYIIVLIFDF